MRAAVAVYVAALVGYCLALGFAEPGAADRATDAVPAEAPPTPVPLVSEQPHRATADDLVGPVPVQSANIIDAHDLVRAQRAAAQSVALHPDVDLRVNASRAFGPLHRGDAVGVPVADLDAFLAAEEAAELAPEYPGNLVDLVAVWRGRMPDVALDRMLASVRAQQGSGR